MSDRNIKLITLIIMIMNEEQRGNIYEKLEEISGAIEQVLSTYKKINQYNFNIIKGEIAC